MPTTLDAKALLVDRLKVIMWHVDSKDVLMLSRSNPTAHGGFKDIFRFKKKGNPQMVRYIY